jgi:hypothetical protein
VEQQQHQNTCGSTSKNTLLQSLIINMSQTATASMKALTFAGKQSIQLADVPKPTLLLPTDVIVRVTLCGICGRCVC